MRLLGIFFLVMTSLSWAQVVVEEQEQHSLLGSGQYWAYHSPSGRLALLYRKIYGEAKLRIHLMVAETDHHGKLTKSRVARETHYRLPGWNHSICYDSKGRLHIFSLLGKEYHHFWRDKQKESWHSQTFPVLPTSLADKIVSYQHLHGEQDHQGNWHLFLLFTSKKGQYLLAQLRRFGTTWKFRVWPWHKTRKFFNFVLDNQGSVHVAYNQDRHLYYARLHGKKWHHQPVLKRANYDTEAAWDAHLAMTNNQPYLVSTYIERAFSGSFVKAHVKFHFRNHDKWQNEVIADKAAAGYTGKDGNRYTGGFPFLTFHQQRPYILFTDIASWHWQGKNERAWGQVRCATRQETTGSWQIQTLFAQPGQNQSPQPIHEFFHPAAVFPLESEKFYYFGEERITKSTSVQFDAEAPQRYRLLLFEEKRKQ